MEQLDVRNLSTQSSRISQLSAKLKDTRVTPPVRILIAILGVSACILLSSTRYNLSIAIVSMVHDSCTPSTSICNRYAEEQQQLGISGLDGANGSASGDVSEANGGHTHSKTLLHRKIHQINAMDSCNQEPLDGTLREKKLNWSEAEQGLALGAYYYGFATTHIFGGRLAERSRWGPKWIIATGLVGAAIFNALLPVTARLNFVVFVVIR